MVKKLIEIRWRKEEAARRERRRALMLGKLEEEFKTTEEAAIMTAMFKVWQDDVVRENRRRELQEAEERRRLEVSELRDQLHQEKDHILSLEATVTRLKGSLKAAAHRMLAKVFSTTQKPWANGHAFRAWCGTHPVLVFENELIRTQQTLEETQEELRDEKMLTSTLSEQLEETTNRLTQTTKERDDLADNYATLMAELQATLGNQSEHASQIKQMAETKAKEAREALIRETWAEANQIMEKMKKDNDSERVKYEDQIGGLEAQLESIKRGLENGKDGPDDQRVVPKGQGILCCGCLRQIVNRGVKQLPPVSLPKAKSPTRKEENMKKLFFQKELQGMPDPDDLLHSEVWKTRRDPMAGLRYASVAPELSWPLSTKSASTSRLTPLRITDGACERIKQELSFQPRAFR
jgi:myosin heavy subunit